MAKVTFVLIETYWNVKKIGALVIFRQSHSINRNILECKAESLNSSRVAVPVLIETYWNVK